MKRFSQSLTAVAIASALTIGGATVAQAQVPAPR
ncbi:putative secreted protein [Corynebacterium jeikeium]|nr:putative secreted protein [Corynebacterium jeikeium]